MMRSLSSCLEATRIWRSTERASLEKKPSTRLSHEPCLGVKVNSKRPIGWSARTSRSCSSRFFGWRARRTRPTFPTGCRSPANWRAARSACARSLRRARRSRGAPGARQGAARAREGGARRQDGRARGQDRRDRQEAQGKPPAPPTEGPLPTDRVNLTDAESRIMPAAGGGFEQGYNAQAAVAAGSLLVVAVDVVQAPNDKNQVEPMLEKIGALPEGLGKVDHLLADTGYFSAGTVAACEKAGVEPAIAMGRQPHHPPLSERFAKAPAAPDDPTPVEAMAHRLKTPEGRALYSLRKQTPEPVFGIIKSALGFRQFSLRGLENVHGEWSLVTMAWNLKRMFVLNPAC